MFRADVAHSLQLYRPSDLCTDLISIVPPRPLSAKKVFCHLKCSGVPNLPPAVLPGGKEAGLPGEPGRSHPEDLPRMEVPQTLPAAQEEPGGGSSLVQTLCGEMPAYARVHTHT